VKIELLLPESLSLKSALLEGKLRFQSMTPERVTHLRISFKERYSRGRGEERLIDEYLLGSLEVEKQIDIPAGKIVELPFSLPFVRPESNVDALEKVFLWKGLAKAVKWANKVESEFRVEAEARIQGTALNPFVRQVIIVKP
jgi:hypothetical protein